MPHSIKLYAWENAFIRKILFVRNEEEMKMLRKIGVVTVSTLDISIHTVSYIFTIP